MLEKYLNFTNKLAQICGIFAAGCLLASIVLITELVFERYIFQNSITWQPELVTMMLVASTFIGAPYVLKEGGHVNMEYVYTLIDEKKKAEAILKKLFSCKNHLDLYSEGICMQSLRLLGNFPQAYSHIGLLETTNLF